MRLIVEIGHPAHVHLFRHVVHELGTRGHQTRIVAREKDVTLRLLRDFGMEYVSLSRQGRGLVGLGAEMLIRDLGLLRYSLGFHPDLFIGLSMCSTHVGALLRKPSIVLDDSEHAVLERRAWLPFATVVCTPSAYKLNLGEKHVRYPGYHELAYLHPNRFRPDSGVLERNGLVQGERFFILRFVSWGAAHDLRQYGLSIVGKRRLVSELSRIGRVIITSEGALPSEFKPHHLRTSPTEIHSLLSYSSLYVGEGATMASEAAILGIPSIYVNSITAGTLEEQEKYGLLYRVTDEERVIELALDLARDPACTREHQRRRQQLLADKIDVAGWLVDLIENTAGRRP